MSRRIANQENIREAAEYYLAKGYSLPDIGPSLIREKIGGGSYSTIGPVLEAWLEERRQQAVQNYRMPIAVKDLMDQTMQRLWDASILNALDQVKHQLEDLEKCRSDNKRLADQIDSMEEKVEALETELRDNQNRFVCTINALNADSNAAFGELLAELKQVAPSLEGSFLVLRDLFNENLGKACNDQTEILSRYLYAAQVGALGDNPAMATTTPESAPEAADAILAELN